MDRDRGDIDRDSEDSPADTGGSNKQQPVEDRPMVGTVTPDDYPESQKGGAEPA